MLGAIFELLADAFPGIMSWFGYKKAPSATEVAQHDQQATDQVGNLEAENAELRQEVGAAVAASDSSMRSDPNADKVDPNPDIPLRD